MCILTNDARLYSLGLVRRRKVKAWKMQKAVFGHVVVGVSFPFLFPLIFQFLLTLEFV